MRDIQLMPTGVPNLDAVLRGGVPVYSLNVIAGHPGTGKTILAQQMLFGCVRRDPAAKALYVTTLSEPSGKVVRYMQHYSFFDAKVFGERVTYQDIGLLLRERPLPNIADHILKLVEAHNPEVLVIDSFKAIRDLSADPALFRHLAFDLSVRLAGARCTAFLVGEYDRADLGEAAEFAVADGIFFLDLCEREGERLRLLQVYKLRGRSTELMPFPFAIDKHGLRILSPALTLRRRETELEREGERLTTGIPGLDGILQGGIPCGRSIILAGVSGTGKTTFALQFLVGGTREGERGLLFSFEETPDRLRRMAAGFGWNLAQLEAEGLLRLVFVPQTDIRVEEHLEQMVQEVEGLKPRRIAVDSFSVFLNKVTDQSVQREKAFQLATLVQRIGAVGLLLSDIPASEGVRLSRSGAEETVADGTIVLSTDLRGRERKRFLEVYKMRAADHVSGRHRMEITTRGMEVLYLPPPAVSALSPVPPLAFTPLAAAAPGGVRYGSTWLVEGEQGVGKSTLAAHFAWEGLKQGEGVLFVATDTPSYLVRAQLAAWGPEVQAAIEAGSLRILDTHPVADSLFVDLTDMERFLYDITKELQTMPRPCRVITDSLTPLAVQYAPVDFLTFVEQKNRVLRRPDVALFDTILFKTLGESALYSLLNSYDVVLNVFRPNWGEMGQIGQGFRVLQVRKAREARVDTRPYPFTVRPGEGVVVQEGFYGQR